MTDGTQPLVSVVIVNHNGAEFLRRCVQSLAATEYPDWELIVSDNGSTDDSRQALEVPLPEGVHVEFLANEENVGPSAARNLGAARSHGRYLAFLDNDTEVHPQWLSAAIPYLEEHEDVGACQCKLLLRNEPGCFDSAGDYLSQLGFLSPRVHCRDADTGQVDGIVDIFSAKSAGMIVKKEAFVRADGFDPDYFIYVEETDLCWRIWLEGYRVIFAPDSIVYHHFGSSSVILPDSQRHLIRYHGAKNYVSSLYKNMGSWSLARTLPVHVSLWLALASWLALKGRPSESQSILQGLAWPVTHWRSLRNKRLHVQAGRKVTDRALFGRLMRRNSILSYYHRFVASKGIGNAAGWNET